MGMKARVIIDKAGLDMAIRENPGRLEAVVDKTGRDVEGTVKESIIQQDIIDTGAHLNSTESREVPGTKLARRIGATMDYSPNLEFGTALMAARPHFVPSLEIHRGPFRAAIREVARQMERG